MYSWNVLPLVSLEPAEPVRAGVIAPGVADFQAAGPCLQALPYGRTADRADFRGVLVGLLISAGTEYRALTRAR